MIEIKSGEEKEVSLQIKTLMIDPEEFGALDMSIVDVLQRILYEEKVSSEELQKMFSSDETNSIELFTEATLKLNQDGNVELSYRENEDDKEMSTLSKIIFDPKAPELVVMTKEGALNTYLSFEQGATHVCTYDTPFMPFKVYVNSKKVDNRLLSDGVLKLNYILNLNGTAPQHFVVDVLMKTVPSAAFEFLAEN